jgi:Holliday junction resolvasome RuvABC endonuclease subunit
MSSLAELFKPAGGASIDTAHDHRSIVGGVDCSPRRIGYAFIYRDTESVLISGTEHTPKGNDLWNRKAAWGRIIQRYLDAGGALHQITAVGLEDAYVKYPRVAITTAMSIGNMEAFVLQAVPWALIDLMPASTWRSTLGLPARGKEAAMEHALAYKDYIELQDEADAICIAQATSRRIVPF